MAKREKKEKDQWDLVLDQIDFKGLTQEEVLGQDGLVKQLTGRLLQRVLDAEMDGHLGYQKHDNSGDNTGDSRNGYSGKTVLTENQEMTVKIPRDRNGTFEPAILPKYQKRVPLFNDQVISMYSLGMTDRDIRNHIKKIYNVEISPEQVSRITDAVIEEVREWQNRPLESSYAIVYLDALRVKSRQEGKSCIKSVYAALCAIIFQRKCAASMRRIKNSIDNIKKIGRIETRRNVMSKYDTLWEYVQKNGSQSMKLSFDEIKNILGIEIDHSFLNYKKELVQHGYQVGKISLKEKTVLFNKIETK